jgi:hypothetical protein
MRATLPMAALGGVSTRCSLARSTLEPKIEDDVVARIQALVLVV